MRRVLAPIDPSETIETGPIWPRASTWVPPQNSSECGPARTTRTTSPYLSPKKAKAPMASASLREASVVIDRVVGQHVGVGHRQDGLELLGGPGPRGG